ncbi:hypothetical protein T08_15758 [Trichinella sp. T8]|nr:hypothetical protein T08_15758 [Trichinella sp. T8]
MYTGFCDNRRVHRSFIKSWVTKKLFKVRSMIIILNATASLKHIYNEQYIAALLTNDYEHKLKITVDGPVWRTL